MYAAAATTSSNPVETSSFENLQKPTSPAVAQPAPSNQSSSGLAYPPLQPAGSPPRLDSYLDAILRAALARIKALEARVFELEKAVNDTSMKEKVAAMEASMKNGSVLSNLKTPTRKSCAVCSKTFLTNADLEKHMNKRHDDSRNFKCTVDP